MSGFEKWWKDFVPFELFKDCDISKIKKEYKCAYIAALKWAISQKVCGIEENGSISTSNMIKVSDIKQELESLNEN